MQSDNTVLKKSRTKSKIQTGQESYLLDTYMKWILSLLTAIILVCSCGKVNRDFEQRLAACEDSLNTQNYASFLRQYQELKPLATDSDQHCQLNIVLAEYYFAKMQCDSFSHANHQVEQYLRRHYPLLFIHPQQEPKQTAQDLYTKWLIRKGVYYQCMDGKLDSAKQYYKAALQRIGNYKADDNTRLNLYYNLADAYKQSGEYDQSIKYYIRALQMIDDTPVANTYKIGIIMGIAASYTWMEAFQQSQIWWNRAAAQINVMSKNDLFIYYNNRGNDYYLQKKYKQSLQCFNQLEQLTRNDSNMVYERQFGRVNQAELYIKTNQPEKARPIIEQTTAFFTKANLKIALFYINTIKLEYYTLTRQWDKARPIADEPIHTLIHPDQQQLRLLAQEDYFKATCQWKKMANEQQIREALEEKIHNNHIRMQFSTALLQYQQDKRLVEQVNETEKQKAHLRLVAFFFIGCLCIIALIMYILYLQRRQIGLLHTEMHSATILMRMQNTRNRITPHFIFNALNHEMLAQMKGLKVNFNTLVTLIRRSIDVTDKFCTTLQSELEFIDYYVEIESQALGSDFVYTKELATDIDTSQIQLPSMIIQIFVENAIKHGLRAKEPEVGKYRNLVVRVNRHDQGVIINVIDNGVGMKTSATHTKSSESTKTGAKVVKNTIALLNEYNKEKMLYGMEDYIHPNGDTGCRSFLYLPQHFSYIIPTHHTSAI